MRKITSKKDNEQKQKRNRIIVSAILIFVMFFSVLGSGFYLFKGEEESKIIYNGYEFVEQNGLLFVQMGEYQFVFKSNPKELPKLGYGIKTLNNYKRE